MLESSQRVDTLEVLQRADTRNLSVATTYFGTATTRETTSGSRARSSVSTPTSSTSEASRGLGAVRSSLSSAGSSDQGRQHSLKSRLSFFGRKGSIPMSPKIATQRYPLDQATFSAKGDTLYLWGRGQTKVAVWPIFKQEAILYTEARVRTCGEAYFLAGGSAKYMVITQTNLPSAQIEVYDNNRPTQQRNESEEQTGATRIETPLAPIPFTLGSKYDTFAISRDDNFAAVCGRSTLSLWNLQARTETSIVLLAGREDASGSAIQTDSQKVAFSADCNLVAVATRFLDGCVLITTWNHEGQLIRKAEMGTHYGRHGDLGLSSVFCDNDLNAAIVTLSVTDAYRVIHSLSARQFLWTPREGFRYEITSAAQSATGNEYVVATSKHSISTFSLAMNKVQVHPIANFSKERRDCNGPSSRIALAYADVNRIYAFWFDKAKVKMFLAIIQDGSTAIREVRSCFDGQI